MSRQFDGSDDNIVNANDPIGAYPLSIIAWFRLDTSTSTQAIANLVNDLVSNQHQVLQMIATKKLSMRTRNSAASQAETTTETTDGVWHHGAGKIIDAADRQVLLDGGGKGTNTDSIVYPTTINKMAIGRLMRSSPADTVDGRIFLVAFYNVVLSDIHIIALSHGVHPFVMRNDGLKALYELGGNLSPEPEVIAQNNGTIVGATRGVDNPPVQLLSRYMSGH